MVLQKLILLVVGLIWTSSVRTYADTSRPILNWKQVTPHAAFYPGSMHTSFVFDNKMWVIGSGSKVWWSSDGANWHPTASRANFRGREGLHTSVVFKKKMWVIGGKIGGAALNDVWWSADGETWKEATPHGEFPPRWQHSSVVFQNKMWVIGGWSPTMNLLNDVWCSGDGETWHKITGKAAFPKRNGHTTLVFDNKMWVIGGWHGDLSLSDVWWSNDGVVWNRATPQASFLPRYDYASITFDRKMWIVGGSSDSTSSDLYNDVWSSNDGINWYQASSQNSFSPSQGHTGLIFNNAIWIIGGYSKDGPKNDVWCAFLPQTPPATLTPKAKTSTVLTGTEIEPFKWSLRSASRSDGTNLADLAKSSQKQVIACVFSPDTPKVSETIHELKSKTSRYNIALILVNDLGTTASASIKNEVGELQNSLYRCEGPPDDFWILPQFYLLGPDGTLIRKQYGVGQGLGFFLSHGKEE